MVGPDIINDIVNNKSKRIRTLDEIHSALDKMAAEITEQLSDSNPILLCVMTGAVMTTAGLATRLHFPLQMDYVHATRYQGKVRAGDLHWKVEPHMDLNGRTVIVVEDILDGGLTLAAIIDYCQSNGAKAVYSAVLVDKKHTRDVGGIAHADFTGMEIEDLFIYGYGLDYEGYLRNMPGIYAVTEDLD
jgi:hypoxanthine phosphoribosyltransferase